MKAKILILILLGLSATDTQGEKQVKIHASLGLSAKTETLLKKIKKNDTNKNIYILNKRDIPELLELLQKTDRYIKATIENISNKRTIAYKKFRTFDTISDQGEGKLTRSFLIGSLIATGRKLDIALSNEVGFFAFKNTSGDVVYSRDGSLFIDVDGFIVNRLGYYMNPKIQLNQNDWIQKLDIAENGVLSIDSNSGEPQRIGQIRIFNFQKSEVLIFEKDCNCFNLTRSKQKPVEMIPGSNGAASIIQSFLELSNVNLVEEQLNYHEFIRFYNLIYDALRRLDPSFVDVRRDRVYDQGYIDSLKTDLK
ncbi:flagellar hook basal-body protein [Leptospira sp. WS92.C1]